MIQPVLYDISRFSVFKFLIFFFSAQDKRGIPNAGLTVTVPEIRNAALPMSILKICLEHASGNAQMFKDIQTAVVL